MEPYTQQVISVIQEIPAGAVATYGQIARLAGNPRAARQVARILHSMSRKYDLPWQRVVNAKGEIVIADSEAAHTQAYLLSEEGVEVSKKGKVNLSRYQWKAEDHNQDWLEG